MMKQARGFGVTLLTLAGCSGASGRARMDLSPTTGATSTLTGTRTTAAAGSNGGTAARGTTVGGSVSTGGAKGSGVGSSSAGTGRVSGGTIASSSTTSTSSSGDTGGSVGGVASTSSSSSTASSGGDTSSSAGGTSTGVDTGGTVGGTSGSGTSGSCVPIDPATAPTSIDPSCFTSTFDDEFLTNDISTGPTADGLNANERWFNGTEQCCMSDSTGLPGVMYPTAGPNGPVNPYSLIAGGGLEITLAKVNGEWFSGVMTSIDANGSGFLQKYGYFEISTQLPTGTGTWPAFWMLTRKGSATSGEIDIFEGYGGNPDPAGGSAPVAGFDTAFNFTLHDWSANTAPDHYIPENLPDLTLAYHRYGLLWNATYLALYFDGQLLHQTPTPSVMNQPYYLLADNGLGGGWITTGTPATTNMLIKYIRAYSVAGF